MKEKEKLEQELKNYDSCEGSGLISVATITIVGVVFFIIGFIIGLSI